MAITATTSYRQVVVYENGLIVLNVVRQAIDNDGTIIGERNTRLMLEPGQDVTAQPQRIQRICQAVWTQAVIDTYNAAKAAGTVMSH